MNEPDSPCAGIGTTSDLVGCLWKAKDKSETKLNAVYEEVKEKLEPNEVADSS